MNKICTSLEQSKKLIELGIDINTADMYYEEVCNLPKAIIGNYIFHNQCMEDRDYKKLSNPVLSPAWSLAALINIIPQELFDGEYIINITEGIDNKWIITYDHYENRNHSFYGLSTGADNLVDACYEMIIKLHEQNLL